MLPYLLLLIAILVGWVSSVRNSLLVLALAVITGLTLGSLTWLAIPSILGCGLLLWLPTHFPTQLPIKILCYVLFLALALLMMLSLAPGYNNLPIYQGVQFSPDSFPFRMTLNFDSTVVGLFIILLFCRTQLKNLDPKSLLLSLKLLTVLALLLLPIAVALNYVRFDFKFPPKAEIWILNNLFFVCVAEEALFRGFIQKNLQELLPKSKFYIGIPILISSLLFGLAHFPGGPIFMGLATIAGAFFGYAFYKTKRLEPAIAAHFGLNLIHFLFFSYPALMK